MKAIRFLLVLAGLLLVISAMGQVDPDQLRVHRFKKDPNISLTVINQNAFNQRYGSIPDVPKNVSGLKALARRIYVDKDKRLFDEGCAEHAIGLLSAGLQNPSLTERDLESVEADMDMPALPLTYTSGHFKFYYTTTSSNPNDNVTLADIKATAVILNNAWTKYAANFKEPKYYLNGGVKMVDVKVYDLGTGLYGVTSSAWNHIELNSKQVVKEPCKRQTTPVHELFHRVQYAYSYLSGTPNLKWAVEATASWSQKYMAPGMGDWMDRMNSGIVSPDQTLFNRSYDMCHYWVYMGQRAGSEANAIKTVWAKYQTNGKNMVNAVASTVDALLPDAYFKSPYFESFAQSWIGANYLKDTDTAPALWEYTEDEAKVTCGTVTHGPLASVPVINATVSKGATVTKTGTVSNFGADYYVFTIGAGVTSTKMQLTGSAATVKLSYFQAELVNNKMVNVNRGPLAGTSTLNLTRPVLNMAGTKKLVIVVMGMNGSGNYTLKMTGTGDAEAL